MSMRWLKSGYKLDYDNEITIYSLRDFPAISLTKRYRHDSMHLSFMVSRRTDNEFEYDRIWYSLILLTSCHVTGRMAKMCLTRVSGCTHTKYAGTEFSRWSHNLSCQPMTPRSCVKLISILYFSLYSILYKFRITYEEMSFALR